MNKRQIIKDAYSKEQLQDMYDKYTQKELSSRFGICRMTLHTLFKEIGVVLRVSPHTKINV